MRSIAVHVRAEDIDLLEEESAETRALKYPTGSLEKA